jgi:hypothetical protein
MEDLIYIYMVTISIELVLSIVLGVILLAILAPLGSARQVDDTSDAPPPNNRGLSPDVRIALRDAFDSLSRGGGDLAPLVHARHLLVKYQAGWMDEGGPPARD